VKKFLHSMARWRAMHPGLLREEREPGLQTGFVFTDLDLFTCLTWDP
jgi:hypothetical protein